jgi:hypothetical protein
MDARTSLRRNPHHDRTEEARRLTRAIESHIREDQKCRTEEAGASIMALLDEGAALDKQVNAKHMYGILRNWYKHHGDRPFKPSRQDLVSVTNKFAALYQQELPSPLQATQFPPWWHPTT